MSPNIGMNDSDRRNVVTILNTLLSDEYVLYTKTRNYHWNVVGPQFNDLHKFFVDVVQLAVLRAERHRGRRGRAGPRARRQGPRHPRRVLPARPAQGAAGHLPRRHGHAEGPPRGPRGGDPPAPRGSRGRDGEAP